MLYIFLCGPQLFINRLLPFLHGLIFIHMQTMGCQNHLRSYSVYSNLSYVLLVFPLSPTFPLCSKTFYFKWSLPSSCTVFPIFLNLHLVFTQNILLLFSRASKISLLSPNFFLDIFPAFLVCFQYFPTFCVVLNRLLYHLCCPVCPGVPPLCLDGGGPLLKFTVARCHVYLVSSCVYTVHLLTRTSWKIGTGTSI